MTGILVFYINYINSIRQKTQIIYISTGSGNLNIATINLLRRSVVLRYGTIYVYWDK